MDILSHNLDIPIVRVVVAFSELGIQIFVLNIADGKLGTIHRSAYGAIISHK
jgi:hypothetical protein